MLTHELNNYTMSEAIKWYPSLRAAFNVNFSNLFLFKNTDLLVRTVRRPSCSGVEQDSAVRREHAYSTVILTMSVTFLNTAKVSKMHIFFLRIQTSQVWARRPQLAPFLSRRIRSPHQKLGQHRRSTRHKARNQGRALLLRGFKSQDRQRLSSPCSSAR